MSTSSFNSMFAALLAEHDDPSSVDPELTAALDADMRALCVAVIDKSNRAHEALVLAAVAERDSGKNTVH